jgi:hypothetical protein
MNVRPVGTYALVAAALLIGSVVPARAQNREITEDYLELIISAFSAERAELEKVAPQLREIDDRIRQFQECKELYEAAGDAAGRRLGGLAARAAIRARCGASDTDGFMKDRQKVMEGPERVALGMLGMRSADYGKLKERMQDYLHSGSGFNANEVAILRSRRGDLAGAMGINLSLLAAGGTGGQGGGNVRGVRNTGMRSWTSDYAWEYIGDIFAIMYLSGATVFEKPYQPGQWTRWEIVERDARYADDNRPDSELESRRSIERAFIGLADDGGEWWRTTTIQEGDTVILESLFKPMNEYMKQLVRVRAKLPGQDANELLVPQHMAMLSLLSVFPMKPTEESVRGATVGSERIANFDARHVRFAAGGGAIEWWIADNAPGGWVQFRHSDPRDDAVKSPGTYTMRMTGSGTGAKSLLGVM